MKKSALIITGVIFFFAILITSWVINVSNSEKKLKLRGEAQQTVCQGYFSNMWEILKSKGAVTTEYAEKNKEFVIALMEGRYSKGDGSFMKWIVEQNPQFDASLYKDLMTTIEAQRKGFFIEQSKLIDIDREHKLLCQVFPNNLIIGNRQQIGGEKGIVILKNEATQDSYKTGKDQSPDLFNK